MNLLHRKLKGFELQGALPPNLLTRGSAPRPRWELHPRLHYRLALRALAMRVHPTFFDLATPLVVVVRCSRWWKQAVRELCVSRVMRSTTATRSTVSRVELNCIQRRREKHLLCSCK